MHACARGYRAFARIERLFFDNWKGSKGMKYAFVFAAALLGSGIARAEAPPTGFYLGAAIGQATVEMEDEDSFYDFKGDDTSYKFFAGYRILPWVAIEASYIDFGQAEDRVVGVPIRTDFTAATIEGLGILPIGNWDLFLKAGFAHWDGSVQSVDFPQIREDDNKWDAIFGIGAQYRVGQFAVRAEGNLLMLGFDDDDDDEIDGDDWIDVISIGFTYSF